MICWILLLFILTSCVCASLVVNVTQSSYQAEENHNITLEWTFTTNTDRPPNSLYIHCLMLTDVRPSILFHLREGVEVPQFQDKQFAGRVQFDKDVLREGRLRLHVSRLRTNDSGLYLCEVTTGYGRNSEKCHLKVTAARDRPETPRPTTLRRDASATGSGTPAESRGRIGLYCGLGLTAALVLYLFALCIENKISTQHNRTNTT